MFSRSMRYMRSFIPIYGATREEKSPIINQEQMEYEMSEYDATKQSNIIPDEHLLDRLEEEGKRNKITEWQAGWNITNAIQVSYVYCSLHS
jgi:hypothetical protein